MYRKIDGVWKITEHHSSAMPEPVVDPLEEVAALFDLWNNTLQTGDPEKVASLYAPDGVLLPTVSNKVRPDHESKVDYFTAFLKLKPFGTINESHVRFLNPQKTLAANSGVYTFKLQKEDGPAEVRGAACCWLRRAATAAGCAAFVRAGLLHCAQPCDLAGCLPAPPAGPGPLQLHLPQDRRRVEDR